MSKAGRFFMGLFKWLVVPTALGFVGYAFIGPHIGRKAPEGLKKIQDQIVSPTAVEPAPVVQAANSDEISSDFPPPKVEVELRRLNGERVEDRQTSKRPVMREDVPESVEPEMTEPETVPNESAPAEAPVEQETEPPAEPLPDGPGAE